MMICGGSCVMVVVSAAEEGEVGGGAKSGGRACSPTVAIVVARESANAGVGDRSEACGMRAAAFCEYREVRGDRVVRE